MRKYIVWREGERAMCDVRDRHSLKKLMVKDCSDPRRSFDTSIFTHNPVHGWIVLATALIHDANGEQEVDPDAARALACQLEIEPEGPISMTRREVEWFVAGCRWFAVMESMLRETPPDPPLPEGGM